MANVRLDEEDEAHLSPVTQCQTPAINGKKRKRPDQATELLQKATDWLDKQGQIHFEVEDNGDTFGR